MGNSPVAAEDPSPAARAPGPAGWWPGETAFEVCAGAISSEHGLANADRALRALAERSHYGGLRE